jgi:hypothetical protein
MANKAGRAKHFLVGRHLNRGRISRALPKYLSDGGYEVADSAVLLNAEGPALD